MQWLQQIGRRSIRRAERGAAFFVAGVVSSVALALALTLALTFVLCAAEASAHARSVSYSSWLVGSDGAEVSLRMPLLELSRLGPAALPPGVVDGTIVDARDGMQGRASAASAASDAVGQEFAEALVLVSNEVACSPSTKVRRVPDAEGFVRYRWRVVCSTGMGSLAIHSRVLLDVAPTHLHFARVRFEASPDTVRERVLTEADPRFVLQQDAAHRRDGEIGSRFVDYLALGIHHILSGWDHIAFLFGLILLSDRLATIARLVTGFTLAHSLTLGLSVLDLIHPRAAAVEAVIAFSVALVAIEKGWLVAGRPRAIPLGLLAGLALLAVACEVAGAALPTLCVFGLMLFTACYFGSASRSQSDRLRIALTFAFGLVHGFGFAGILLELELPTERLVPALAGFNLGVEIGQIGIVLLAWPALVWAARATTPSLQGWARDLATAGLCGLGCFWLFERAFSF